MDAVQVSNEGYKPSPMSGASISRKVSVDSEEYFQFLMSKLAARQHRFFELDEEWGNQLEED